MMFRLSSTRLALLVLATAGAVSTTLYLAQGGFGGGHGRFDLPIFLLGLPWDLLPAILPESLWSDFWCLVGLPCFLNIGTVLAVSAAARRLRSRTKAPCP